MNFFDVLEQEGVVSVAPSGELAPIDYRAELDRARASFEALRKECLDLEDRARALVVSDESSAALAVEMGTLAQSIARQVKVKMEAIIAEPNDFVRRVRNIAKTITEPLERAMDELRAKRDRYLKEEARRKVEEEARAREAARKLQEELARQAMKKAGAEAKAKGIPREEVKVEEIVIPAPIIEAPKTTVRAETGTAFQKEGRWTFEVVDISKVPAEFLEVNAKAVNQQIRAGVREIPGLKIYQEEAKTVFRAR